MIEARNVSKRYRLYSSPAQRLRDTLLRRSTFTDRWALRGVSLTVHRGESVALLGANGAGKSTLLGLIAGTSAPTEGEIKVAGGVAALLELGAGFHPEWTGRQNAELHLRLARVGRARRAPLLREIQAFADIGAYFDQPLRTYSSGMAMRVAFAAAACLDPDVLVVDEALAVGDAAFQHKCFRRITELKEKGRTILLVTHRLDLVPQLCSRAIVLHEGEALFDGPPGAAIARYFDTAFSRRNGSSAAPGGSAAGPALNRYEERGGSGEARITSITMVEAGAAAVAAGSTASFVIEAEFGIAVDRPVVGFAVRTLEDVFVYMVNTDMMGVSLRPAEVGERRRLRLDFQPNLPSGSVFLDFSLMSGDSGELHILDMRMSAVKLDVAGTSRFVGLVDLRARLSEQEPAAADGARPDG
ncbi:MAG TPA: ABC transporter ATP-binding protein [Allosphingosinicella sp.]